MASITDKFGKASIDSDYAIATTVKTTRSSGATVLEAFDVSKFPDDTPAFFVTYKKTTDPVTGIVSATNLVSWKALVNAGANTLTNLTLAPGYSDSGNAPGDFIELVPTSFWENTLVDGLLVSHNQDGTLKGGGVAPTGVVNQFAGSTAPTGWLLCYGQAISRTTYASLFAVIGEDYGAGDGSTTFLLPDLRGRVIAGQDDMGGASANRLTGLSGGVDGDTLGAVGGSEKHTLTEAQLASHRHTYKTQSGSLPGVNFTGSYGTMRSNNNSYTADENGNYTGGGQAHNNVQPTIIMNHIIKT